MSILGGFDAYNKYWLSHSSDTFDRGTWSRGFRYKQQSPSTGWPLYKHSWSSWRPHSCILLLIVLRYYVLCTSDHCLTFLFFTSRSLPIPSSRRTFWPYDSWWVGFRSFPRLLSSKRLLPWIWCFCLFLFSLKLLYQGLQVYISHFFKPLWFSHTFDLVARLRKKGIHSMVPFTLPNRYV